MTRLLLLTLVVLLAPAIVPVYAADKQKAAPGLGIAAVVGEEAISSFDVDKRIQFILATTKLSSTPDVIASIRRRVIQSLVDEKIQLQEAARKNITVSDQEIDAAIVTIESQRGMPSGTIAQQLQAARAPVETFREQLRAQVAWNKLLLKVVRPGVRISDGEIELAQKKLLDNSVTQELKIGVLAIPVEKPAGQKEVRSLAEKLASEIRKGASFEEVARQFGNSAGALPTFWVRPSQLDPKLAKVLEGAKPGTVTAPTLTDSGITIVKVYDAKTASAEEAAGKDIEVVLKEILLKLKSDASAREANVLLQIGEDVAKHPGTCEEKGVANINNLQDFDIAVNFNRALLSELPPAVKIIAEQLKVGDISTPFASEEGIRLYMLCGKKEAPVAAMDRERIANVVYQQKMELEAQKYMRDLRRDAFIEIRG